MKRVLLVALALIASINLADASSTPNNLRKIFGPIVQSAKFNGIEAILEIALVPSWVNTEMSPSQLELLERWADLNSKCRGNGTEEDCEERNKVDTILRKMGVCYGRKSDVSMAEAEWHLCDRRSLGYEVGSESVTFSCRPGKNGEISVTIEDYERFFEDIPATTTGTAEIFDTDFSTPVAYMAGHIELLEADKTLLSYEPQEDIADILLNLYEAKYIILPIGKRKLVLSLPAFDKDEVRDDIARMYTMCKP
jgi:hypothetical protein